MTSIELARRIIKDAKAWAVRPGSGDGEVRIRVIVDPKMPENPDATWLEAQLVLGDGFSTSSMFPSTIVWSDPDD